MSESKQGKILIVDDNEDLLKAAKMHLKRHFAQVDIEKNPEAFTSLITDRSRVYKGGSWKDVAYWMSPGTRRYLDQDSATATIGFRCAMIRAGSNY